MSVRRSLAWSYVGQGFTFLVNFASSVILARLLSPHQMGVYAIAMAASAILAILTSFSIQAYIIREGSLTRDLIRSAYTVNSAMSLLLATLILALGSLERYVLGAPDVGAVLLLIALGPLISMWEFVPTTLYQREMNYGVLSRVGMLRATITACVVLASAYKGLGAVSLAIGPLIASIFTVIYYNVSRRRDIVLRPTLIGLKSIFIFGMQIMSISGVAQITQRLSDIILGQTLGLSALGLYTRASTVSGMIFSNIYGLATNVIFVELSKNLRETGSIHETFVRSIRILTATFWPLTLGLAILARPAIYIAYGERWLAAALPLSLLMIAQFIVMGFAINWELFVLRRETARQTKFEITRAIVGLASFSIGALFSIGAAAAGRVAEAAVGYMLYRPHIDRLAGAKHGELEGVFSESFQLTVVAIAPSLVLMFLSRWSATTSPLLIVGAIGLGIACWFAVLFYKAHPLIIELKGAIAKFRTAR